MLVVEHDVSAFLEVDIGILEYLARTALAVYETHRVIVVALGSLEREVEVAVCFELGRAAALVLLIEVGV